MRTLKQIFTLTLMAVAFIALVIPANAQWSSSNSGTIQDLNGVHVLSPVKAFITGNAGTLRATTDGGATWTPIAIPTVQDVNGIYFIDAFMGYASVDNGGVLKTTDGGTLWSFNLIGTANNLRDIHFADANTGYVVGENGTIFTTTNGGTNWSMQTSGTTERLESVFFTSAMVGFVVGRNGVYLTTTNGGATWTSGSIGTTADLDDVFFVDANTGFISRQNNFIHKTTDGGATWTAISTNAIGNGFDAMHFTDANNGFGVNNNGFLAKSTTGGTTWVVEASGTAQNLNDIHCFDGSNCITVGDLGTVITNLAPQGCITPSGLVTSNITAISATLNWTVVDAANSYEIQGREVGSTALISITIPSGTTNSFNVAGLAVGTSYEWQIRSICGPGQMSDFSAFTSFSTFECLPPSPVSTTNITGTTARLNWTTVTEAQGYTIFGRVVGSTQVVTINVAGNTTSFFDVSGLAPGTSYEWSAISVCNIAGAATSGLANVETFTTLPSASSKLSSTAAAGNWMDLYPNPAVDQVKVNWNNNLETNTLIQISDMNGRIVSEIHASGNAEEIDISQLSNGVYHIILSNGEFVKTQKLMVNK